MACSLLAISFSFTPLSAQVPAATVSGRVAAFSTERPLVGARVSVQGTNLETTTGPEGHFVLHGVPVGIQYFRVRFDNTLSNRLEVPVEAGRENQIEIFVELGPIPLAPLRVSVASAPEGKLAGFYNRMQRAKGVFITRAEIEQRDPMKTSDLFRSLPGVRVERFGPGESSVGMARGPTACPIEYFLDGMRIASFDVDAVPPDVIDGIEVYRGPAEVPPQFRRESSCAAIVIWTRDPGG